MNRRTFTRLIGTRTAGVWALGRWGAGSLMAASTVPASLTGRGMFLVRGKPVSVDGKLLVATENNGTRLYTFTGDGKIVRQTVASNENLTPDKATPVYPMNKLTSLTLTALLLAPLAGVHAADPAPATPAPKNQTAPALARMVLQNPSMNHGTDKPEHWTQTCWHFFDKGDGSTRRRVDTINIALKEFADGKKIRLLDVSERVLNPDRELELTFYAEDKLHLSAEGYRVWADAMDPVLEEFLK